MHRPRFSVVIPTRNAEGTLGATLRTCLEQEFEDYEIVVSDNSSTSATETLLTKLNAPRIRRVRPERPLSMQENWEFAVSHAEGEFILVLGSDDGLMLHSLKELDRLLHRLNVPLLRWEPVCYNWPSLPAQDHASPHTLLMPLKQVNYYHPIRWRDSRQVLEDVAAGRISYSELPSVYFSAVHRDLLDTLRKRIGRVFDSDCPDIYSGVTLAYLEKRYCTLDAPLSIAGLSGSSNGVATIFLKNRSDIARDFHTLNQKRATGRDWPSWIPDLPLMATCTAHAFQNAKSALFPDDPVLAVDRRQLVAQVMKEHRSSDEGEWNALRKVVRKSVSDDPALLAWFEAQYGSQSLADCPPQEIPQLKRYGGPYMQLDASDFGVRDVWEAALLCEKLLGYKRDGLNVHLQPGVTTGVPGAPAPAVKILASSSGSNLYQQETELEILKLLAGKVKSRTFVDVGAEKGLFSQEFINLGFQGVLFEPFANHLPALESVVQGTDSRVFALAVDAADGEGLFHIAHDHDGRPLEYFHSLQASPSATNFKHREGMAVTCRSLESLAKEGVVAPEIGILKIDTEGCDLRVLQGMGPVRAEVLMCEFVTRCLYPDWVNAFPEALIAEAQKLGYECCIAVSRFDEHEMVHLDPLHFVDGEWGNLIFTSSELLRSVHREWDFISDRVRNVHVARCLRAHRELVDKEAVIQDQALQLKEKEAVIQQQVLHGATLQGELQKSMAKTEELKLKKDELRSKVAALKEKNEKLRARH